MVRAVCACRQVPAELVGPVVLGVASAAVGAGIEVRSGTARTSRGNLYVLVGAESGSGKTEGSRGPAAPLLDVDRARLEHWRREVLPGAEAEARLLTVEIGALERKARALKLDPAARDDVRAELRDKLRALACAKTAAVPPRLLIDDATTEALTAALAASGEVLTSFSTDARQVIDNLLGRYRDGGTDEGVYLKGWSGDRTQTARIMRAGETLDRPCLSGVWLVQPDRLRDLLGSATMADSGMLPRLLVAQSGAEPQEISEGGTPPVPLRVREAWSARVAELLNAFRPAPWDRPENQPAPVVVPEPAVDVLMREHHNSVVRRWRSGELRDVGSYAARWTEQAWRVALCLHALAHGPAAGVQPLTEATARAALEIAGWFEGQQLRALAAGRAERLRDRLEKLCVEIAGYGGEATFRKLRRSHGFDADEINRLATEFPGRLVVTKHARPEGGRPSEKVALARRAEK